MISGKKIIAFFLIIGLNLNLVPLTFAKEANKASQSNNNEEALYLASEMVKSSISPNAYKDSQEIIFKSDFAGTNADSFWYFIDLGLEFADLSTTFNKKVKTVKLINYSQERIAEIDQLISEKKSIDITTLEDTLAVLQSNYHDILVLFKENPVGLHSRALYTTLLRSLILQQAWLDRNIAPRILTIAHQRTYAKIRAITDKSIHNLIVELDKLNEKEIDIFLAEFIQQYLDSEAVFAPLLLAQYFENLIESAQQIGSDRLLTVLKSQQRHLLFMFSTRVGAQYFERFEAVFSNWIENVNTDSATLLAVLKLLEKQQYPELQNLKYVNLQLLAANKLAKQINGLDKETVETVLSNYLHSDSDDLENLNLLLEVMKSNNLDASNVEELAKEDYAKLLSVWTEYGDALTKAIAIKELLEKDDPTPEDVINLLIDLGIITEDDVKNNTEKVQKVYACFETGACETIQDVYKIIEPFIESDKNKKLALDVLFDSIDGEISDETKADVLKAFQDRDQEAITKALNDIDNTIDASQAVINLLTIHNNNEPPTDEQQALIHYVFDDLDQNLTTEDIEKIKALVNEFSAEEKETIKKEAQNIISIVTGGGLSAEEKEAIQAYAEDLIIIMKDGELSEDETEQAKEDLAGIYASIKVDNLTEEQKESIKQSAQAIQAITSTKGLDEKALNWLSAYDESRTAGALFSFYGAFDIAPDLTDEQLEALTILTQEMDKAINVDDVARILSYAKPDEDGARQISDEEKEEIKKNLANNFDTETELVNFVDYLEFFITLDDQSEAILKEVLSDIDNGIDSKEAINILKLYQGKGTISDEEANKKKENLEKLLSDIDEDVPLDYVVIQVLKKSGYSEIFSAEDLLIIENYFEMVDQNRNLGQIDAVAFVDYVLENQKIPDEQKNTLTETIEAFESLSVDWVEVFDAYSTKVDLTEEEKERVKEIADNSMEIITDCLASGDCALEDININVDNMVLVKNYIDNHKEELKANYPVLTEALKITGSLIVKNVEGVTSDEVLNWYNDFYEKNQENLPGILTTAQVEKVGAVIEKKSDQLMAVEEDLSDLIDLVATEVVRNDNVSQVLLNNSDEIAKYVSDHNEEIVNFVETSVEEIKTELDGQIIETISNSVEQVAEAAKAEKEKAEENIAKQNPISPEQQEAIDQAKEEVSETIKNSQDAINSSDASKNIENKTNEVINNNNTGSNTTKTDNSVDQKNTTTSSGSSNTNSTTTKSEQAKDTIDQTSEQAKDSIDQTSKNLQDQADSLKEEADEVKNDATKAINNLDQTTSNNQNGTNANKAQDTINQNNDNNENLNNTINTINSVINDQTNSSVPVNNNTTTTNQENTSSGVPSTNQGTTSGSTTNTNSSTNQNTSTGSTNTTNTNTTTTSQNTSSNTTTNSTTTNSNSTNKTINDLTNQAKDVVNSRR